MLRAPSMVGLASSQRKRLRSQVKDEMIRMNCKLSKIRTDISQT